MRAPLLTGACLAVLACASETTGPAGTTYSTTPPGPTWSGSAMSVAVGQLANCLVATDGTPWCWGSPRGTEFLVDDGIRDRNATYSATWIRDSVCQANAVGGVIGWPCIAYHPVRMSTKTFTSLSLSMDLSPLCGLDGAGDTWCWNSAKYQTFTPDSTVGLTTWCGNTFCYFSPRQVRVGAPARQIVTPGPCVLTTAGVVRCAGGNYYNQLSATANLGMMSESLYTIASPVTFTALVVPSGGTFLCGLAGNGKAWCWGQNDNGQAGVGNYNARITAPTQVSTAQTFTALAATGRTVCGLNTSGQAWCWGNGAAGELGWNGLGTSNVPVAVSGGRSFASLIAGPTHFCGLEPGGSAWCWGYDQQGQLGNDHSGTCASTAAFRCAMAPTKVVGGLSFRQLSGGIGQTCGVTLSGQVYCWGMTDYGRLGSYTIGTEVVAHPVQIMP